MFKNKTRESLKVKKFEGPMIQYYEIYIYSGWSHKNLICVKMKISIKSTILMFFFNNFFVKGIYVKPLDAKTAMKRYLTSEGVGKNRNKASSSIIEKDKSQVAIQLGPVDTSQAISEKEDCARYADINVLCFQFADIIQKLVFIFCLPWLSLLGISIAGMLVYMPLLVQFAWFFSTYTIADLSLL